MLFEPDKFSTSQPVFSPCDRETSQHVSERICTFFPSASLSLLSFEQFGGAEVNSRNYKFTANGYTYIAKWIDAEFVDNIENACQIAKALVGRNIPIITPVSTLSEKFIAKDIAGGWTVWHFTEGNYFSGHTSELINTANAIRELQKELSALPPTLQPPAKVLFNPQESIHVINRTNQAQSRWSSIFGDDYACKLREFWPKVTETVEEILIAQDQFQEFKVEATHFDLHPHNILIKDCNIAGFLDADSILTYPTVLALGFAAFKLYRQHLAYCIAENDQSISIIPLEDFTKALAPDFSLNELILGAQLEVCRRIGYILATYQPEIKYDRNYTLDWGHVLVIQLTALAEILWLRNHPSLTESTFYAINR